MMNHWASCFSYEPFVGISQFKKLLTTRKNLLITVLCTFNRIIPTIYTIFAKFLLRFFQECIAAEGNSRSKKKEPGKNICALQLT